MTQFQRYDLWKANYSNGFFDVNLEVAPAPGNKGLLLKLSSDDKTGRLMYGISGKHFPKNYTGPVLINQNSHVTGLIYKGNKMLDSISLDLKFNKATGKNISLLTKPTTNYPGEGAFTLVNGVINELGLARAKEFLGFRGESLQAVIDMGTAQQISSAVVHAIITGGSRVYPPESAEVLLSADGQTFTSVGQSREAVPGKNGKATFNLSFPATNARYIKLVVNPVMKIAEGKPGAGETALMFIDEIEIN
jgi:hexosaminidase